MTYTDLQNSQEMEQTITNAFSSINTALSSISSAFNELDTIATTYEALSENERFTENVAVATALAEEVSALFVDAISTAPQIEG